MKQQFPQQRSQKRLTTFGVGGLELRMLAPFRPLLLRASRDFIVSYGVEFWRLIG